MQIEGINVVFLWVRDVDRALNWYTNVLGLEAGPRYGDWQEFNVPGGTRFAVHGGRTEAGQPTAVVAFGVPDLAEAMAHMAGAGATPIGEITDTGAARFATYVDPDGNQVQLLEKNA
ncbi:MAG TPA: VOC family protein [Acidimicrobiia bacterium]|nr:VOC family protein [Acidimicrobiia bacterium]